MARPFVISKPQTVIFIVGVFIQSVDWIEHLILIGIIVIAIIVTPTLCFSANKGKETIQTGQSLVEEKRHTHVVERFSDAIACRLQRPETVSCSLFCKNVITSDEDDLVRTSRTHQAKCNMLLKIVCQKHCEEKFCSVLEETQYPLTQFINWLEENRRRLLVAADCEGMFMESQSGFLSPGHLKLLAKYHKELQDGHDVDGVLTDLVSRNVIDEIDRDIIRGHETNRDRMTQLLKCHIYRGTYSDLIHLREALVNAGSVKHVKILTPILVEAGFLNGKFLQDDGCMAHEDNRTRVLCLHCTQGDRENISSDVQHQVSRVSSGSIVIHLTLHSLSELDRLRQEIKSGVLASRFGQWFKTGNKKRMWIASLEVIEEEVLFSYCTRRGEWYWSIDGITWCHASRMTWPCGQQKGRVLSRKDATILTNIRNNKELQEQLVKQGCVICQKTDISEKSIYESVNKNEAFEVAVRIYAFDFNRKENTKSDKTWRSLLSDKLFVAVICLAICLLLMSLPFIEVGTTDMKEGMDKILQAADAAGLDRHARNKVKQSVISYIYNYISQRLSEEMKTHVEEKT